MSARPNAYVGQPFPRVEDQRFLTGQGTFVADLHRPGLLHAVILRSPVAHGRLDGIDCSAARSLPGVAAILTAADLDGDVPRIPVRIAPLEGTDRFAQPVIAQDRVRYVGEPLAIVVAETRAIAEDAIELIGVEIEDLPAVGDAQTALAPQSLLFETAGSNIAFRYEAGIGDADAAFGSAHHVRSETFRIQRHTAMPMELRGLMAEWDGRHMIVWGAAKVPFFNRRLLARMLDLPEQAVDLMEVDVGGGFGVRGEFYPEDFLVPLAARLTGRPVAWQEDRREHMLATNHSREMSCELSMACSRDGDILGMKARILGDLGAYVGTTGAIVASRAGQFLPGPYRIPHLALHVTGALTNKTPVGSYRGPGRFEASFFRERLMDMMAADLGIDAASFRRRNLLCESELPHPLGQLVPYEAAASYDSGDYQSVFEQCLREIGWSEHLHLQGKLVDGRYHGMGIGCFVDSSGAGPRENARITIEADGSVTVAVGSSSLGQGIETAFTQIVADALEVPPERIRVRHGSTTLLAEGFGSFHSRSMIMGGNAVLDAAAQLLEAVRAAGAAAFGCAPGQIVYSDGMAIGPSNESRTLAELVRGGASLAADGTFGTAIKPFSYGTHAARVAVDAETGEVELLDYVAVEDVGRIINPAIVHGQKIGAIVQGLGGTFLEELAYDECGQLLTGSLADYLLPTCTDFPRIRAIALELRPTTRNPMGVKGAGEDGIAAVAAAAGNAVAAALAPLGVQPIALPLSPPRLWALVRGAGAGAAEAKHPAQAASPAGPAVAPV